jgi:hypothetical protein
MRSASAGRVSSAPSNSFEGLNADSESGKLVISILQKARSKSTKNKKISETEKRLMQRFASNLTA